MVANDLPGLFMTIDISEQISENQDIEYCNVELFIQKIQDKIRTILMEALTNNINVNVIISTFELIKFI